MSASVVKGDRFIYVHPDAEHADRLFIEVTRVARDGSWADLRCCTWAVMWTKRQTLPLPRYTAPCAWTVADVKASEPSDEQMDARIAARAGVPS